MYSIKRIKIAGFRRLQNVDIEVRPLTVVIGVNGAGKTTLMDSFSLLEAAITGKLNEKLSQFSGITAILTRDGARNLIFEVELSASALENYVYHLDLQANGASYQIAKELFYQVRGYDDPLYFIKSHLGSTTCFGGNAEVMDQEDWDYNPLETCASQIPAASREIVNLRRTFSQTCQYHGLDISSRAPIKHAQTMKPVLLPGSQGESLTSQLYYLRETNKECYNEIFSTLEAAFPSLLDLNFPPVAAGLMTMTWTDKNLRNPLYLHELSEGIVRFIWLTALLYSPKPTPLTMIDQPEVSLHPDLLSILADLMRQAAGQTQLIVATDSDRFLRSLFPQEVLIFNDNGQGRTTAVWADQMNLESWTDTCSLDDIWRMGHLGGIAT